MSSVRGSLRRSRRPGPAGPLASLGPQPRTLGSLGPLGSLGSLPTERDSVHGVLDSLMGEGARMQPKYALEDYIYEVQARDMPSDHHHRRLQGDPGGAAPGDPDGGDVYAQLQQKEKDLILAAELGKALLEKNEELSRQNEKIAEEFSQKLEVLEQDRHALRRKLAATASEADSRLLELQADVRGLQRAVEERELALRSTEREKAALVAELTEQNTRLAAQLKESSRTEEQLTAQLQGLRDQCNLRKSSLQDHVSSLEMLRDEINMLTDKKAELERRMATLLAERDQLNAALEDANERILLLERTTREQEMQLRQNRRELEEIRLVNGSLTSPSSSPLSLPHGLPHGHRSLLDEMECEDSSESGFVSTSELQSLKEEAVASYRQLRDLARRLRKDDSSIQGDSQSEPESLPSVDENNCSKFKTGQLGEAVRDVTRLFGELLDREGVEGEVVEVELHRAREDLDRTRRQLEERSDELKRRSDQVMELTSMLSIREAELAGAQEERDRARADMDETHLAKDEIVRKAWEVRDGAVARKNKVEVQLARTRIDVLQANSQLMEAIQQKVELSQQLEQWQMDMQALLDEQMKRKLTTQEQRSRQIAAEAASETTTPPNDKKRTSSSLRLFSLFQR